MAKPSTAGAKDRQTRGIIRKRQKLNSVSDEAVEDAEQQKEERMSKTSPSFSLSLDVRVPPYAASCLSDKGDRNKIRETLRLFQAALRKLLQEKETKLQNGKNEMSRIYSQAANIVKNKGKYVNTGKQIVGTVAGVEVGDEFNFRVELMMIGLHRPSQAGIDYVKVNGKVIATSIVASWGYGNDVENSNVLIFSGHGGNLNRGDKEPQDQKLERGNLAMKNSIDEKNAVRVIRGFKESNPSSENSGKRHKVTRSYVYDGIYTVERYWQEIGQHAKKVYMFELKRLPDQPELTWKEIKIAKKLKLKEPSLVDDISEGKERFPIRVANTLSDEKPPPFTYITRMMYPDWCKPPPSEGCNCTMGCSDSRRCPCVVKNGGEIPFNYDGAIVEAKFLVFECGPSCKCPPSCQNRVSQNGIRFQLEVFKTKQMGWGVRSLNPIPSGSFICEYIGELLEDKEADNRTGNDEYLFDIGQNYNEYSLWEGLSDHMPDAKSSSDEIEDTQFTIDAVQYGNIGRFINHSCSPNLYTQHVLYDHDDSRIPHIMLFASEDILPLQELTYDYNYAIGQVHDKDGNVKVKNCYCGSAECTGRMY